MSLKVVLRCRDFAAARRFYAEILGLRAVEEWTEEQGQGCVFDVGGAGFLEIYQMTRADPRFRESFGEQVANDKVDLQIGIRDVDAWARRLTGVWSFEGPEDLPWGQRWIRLRDPDGLLVALYQGHDPSNPS